ncbi:unnamed protein product [Paramecium sonneborni]|uniref:Uncharacterized protein n=1 Tax=Paramecium sonneborni TaxID=65129 RepID=A0A8S1M1D8_9CILI|nr:unnamed protein product [Paramecium sonneborni]
MKYYLKNKKKIKSLTNQNRGKPPNLKSTQLKIPNLWTNQFQCIQLFKFLTEEGRHVYFHLAGKRSQKVENEKKNEVIQNTRKFYEYAQDIAEKLFKIKCDSKRCIVFFFRNPNEEQSIYNFSQYIQNEIYQFILYGIHKLLSEKFVYDLIYILGHENEINNVIDYLFQVQEQPSNYSQIIQNLFIKQKIQRMKEEQKQKPSIEIVQYEFQDFLKDENTRYRVRIFIEEILNIFQAQSKYYEQYGIEN